VGFVSTLTGPNAPLGIEIRDGFNLALKETGGKLGGLAAQVEVADDQFNPETGKQVAERMVRRDKVDFLTGIVFSNIMLAATPTAFENKVFYISPNAAPSPLAGAGCSPWFFASSWPNDAYHEAAGQYATDKGIKSVVLLAPNYQAGKDSMTGFKRFYKGQVVDEIYSRLGLLDYSAEIAQIRAAKPQTVYFFLPGGMGVNFIKQAVASGLTRDVQLLVPGFGDDQDIIRGVGDPMLGVFDAAHWSVDLDNPANRTFVADFQKTYGRLPSVYAAQGYDAALLIDGAVREVKGHVEDKAALRKALKSAPFKSVRGDFKFNTNGMPIQNYYLRVVGRDSEGRLVNKKIGTIFTDHGDAYAGACKLN
jgi:branched-chain amino acid transport system substrate-binding protein